MARVSPQTLLDFMRLHRLAVQASVSVAGVPQAAMVGFAISDQFEMTERIKLLDKGTTLQIEYIMTDPKNWKGEWRSTKRWIRQDYSDIYEVECLPNLNQHLPSTEEGQAALKEREKAAAPDKP